MDYFDDKPIKPATKSNKVTAIGVMMLLFASIPLLAGMRMFNGFNSFSRLPRLLNYSSGSGGHSLSFTEHFEIGFGFFIILLIGAYNIACFVAALGILNRKPWARKFYLFHSFIMMLRDVAALIGLIWLCQSMIAEGGRGTDAVAPIGSILGVIVIINLLIYVFVWRTLKSEKTIAEFTTLAS